MSRTKSTGILILSIILSLFVAFNGTDANVRIAMIAYAVTSAIIVMFMLGIPAKKFEFATIGGAITKDLVFGAMVGIGFIFLNSLDSIFSLGAPQSLISLGAFGQFAAIVLIAPVVEEFLFRGFIQPYLYNLLGKKQFLSNLIQAVAFGLFHFAVYGGFLGLYNAPGIFIGAMVFGLVAGFLVPNNPKKADLTTLERPIAAHMVFNFWLWNLTYALIVIGI